MTWQGGGGYGDPLDPRPRGGRPRPARAEGHRRRSRRGVRRRRDGRGGGHGGDGRRTRPAALGAEGALAAPRRVPRLGRRVRRPPHRRQPRRAFRRRGGLRALWPGPRRGRAAGTWRCTRGRRPTRARRSSRMRPTTSTRPWCSGSTAARLAGRRSTPRLCPPTTATRSLRAERAQAVSIRPVRRAVATAREREGSCSLRSTADTWCATVFSDRTKRAAICGVGQALGERVAGPPSRVR